MKNISNRTNNSSANSVLKPSRRSANQSLSQLPQSQSQEWWATGILNISWVLSYLVIGSTRFVTKWSIFLFTVVLLRLPKWVFVTSNKLHLTISFPTFLFLAVLTAYITYSIMKGNVFGQYKHLVSDELDDDKNANSKSRNKESIKLNTTSPPGRSRKDVKDRKPTGKKYGDEFGYGTSYLDQFLSAIKIFGYLEKPVLHDLTKHMKTQKLDEGEILLLDNSIGFCIVVEGTLQLYHEVEQDKDEIYNSQLKFSGRVVNDDNDPDRKLSSSSTTMSSDLELKDIEFNDEMDNDDPINEDNDSTMYLRLKNGLGKFQLLNTVKPGNPVSSLVNILNLFTSQSSNILYSNTSDSRSPSVDLDTFQFQFGRNKTNSNPIRSSPNMSTINAASPIPGGIPTGFSQFVNEPPVVMPDVIARAATDCTIAIIPPQAFSKLTEKYPRSASHIIQMILTRLFRVTFQTANDYLGLTQELMKMEVLLNRAVSYELPFYLKEAVIRKLDKQSNVDVEQDTAVNSNTNDNKTNNEQNSHKQKKNNNDNYNINDNEEKRDASQKIINKSITRPNLSHLKSNSNFNSSATSLRGSRHVVIGSRDHLNPGDLLSSVPLSRKEPQNHRSKISKDKVFTTGSPVISSVPSESPQIPSISGTNQNKLLPNTTSSSFSTDKSSKSSSINGFQNGRGPLSGFNAGPKEDELTTRLFSAAQEETEESAVRMALIEAMFTYLGVRKENMDISPISSSFAPSRNSPSTAADHIYKRSESVSSASNISVTTDFTNRSPSTNLRILPSDYVVNTQKFKSKKKEVYREELSPNLDFNSAKSEFSQGIKLLFYKQGTTIVEQNSKGKGLFYIVSGKIDVSINSKSSSKIARATDPATPSTDRGSQTVLFTVGAGGVAGYLSSLIGYKSFVNLKAKTDVYVGFLPNQTLERLCDKYFMIYLRIAETLTNLMSPKMLKFDHALEWIQLSASDTLFNQGDPANGVYLVLNGRLRQFQTSTDVRKKREDATTMDDEMDVDDEKTLGIMNELAQGESFGEVEVLTAINRTGTIVAVRDSELARIPRTLFEILALEHPSIMIRVSRLVARKILGRNDSQGGASSNVYSGNGPRYDLNATIPPMKPLNASRTHNSHVHRSSTGTITYRTITILPITAGLPVEAFAMKIVKAFKQVGRTTIGLNQRTALSHLGRHAFDRLAKLKKSGYFAELEEMYQTVVYIADTAVASSWTKTCISQADCILLLADATASTEIGEYERLLLKFKTTARTELILLHPDRFVEPGLTHKWLRARTWVQNQHHIQFAVNSLEAETEAKHTVLNSGAFLLVDKLIQTEFSKKTQENISRIVPDSIKARVESFSSKLKSRKRQYYTPVHAHKNDFLRLARILSGQAIGLVLGGGGARGISHLGVLKAIEEHGIPIDMIGGTSIGSFVGGLYAKDYDLVPIYGRVKKFAGRIASIWRMMTDLTWPVTSYTTGHEFNRGIWKTFGEVRIEDFWIQYYCNSTNITDSVQEIHSSGYAWRYIRASMSLAGLLPPLEDKGSMLLDGGYLDNLPVWEMKARGCNTIFAIDVGSVDDRTPMNYGDSLNGFWIILNRWNPFSPHPNIPNMAEIQMRLGYVASVNALEKAKRTPGVIYARPPIEGYATLDFSKFEEIYEVGATYGHKFLQELIELDKMPVIPGSKATTVGDEMPEFLLQRRNSI